MAGIKRRKPYKIISTIKMKCRQERLEQRVSLLRQRNVPVDDEISFKQDVALDKTNARLLRPPGRENIPLHEHKPRRGQKRKASAPLEPKSLNKTFAATARRKAINRLHTPPIKAKLNRKPARLLHDCDNDPIPQIPLHSKRSVAIATPHKAIASPAKKSRSQPQLPGRVTRAQSNHTSSCHSSIPESNSGLIDPDFLKPIGPHRSHDEVFTREINHMKSRLRSRPINDHDRILRTDDMYFVVCDIDPEDVVLSPKKEQHQPVEIPSFRINLLANSYRIEGTEDLEDETFLKRHQKLEVDERRRKRWDEQRIREQTLYEKLKEGRTGPQSLPKLTTKLAIESFLPVPLDANQIEICDKMPVNAFGYPIPSLQPGEFSFPWKCSPNSASMKTTPKKGIHSKKKR